MHSVLITGGAGFVGSHLAEACLKRGLYVAVVDDLSTGSYENISSFEQIYPGRFSFVRDTVLNGARLEENIRRCDTVVHLAAAVGVEYIINNPLSSFHINIQGTEAVLDLCSKYRRRVLIASTSEVYGKRPDAPLRENDDCIYGPSSKFRWSYAASKLMDEFYALAYFRDQKLPVVIVRLFNTVGPRQTGTYGMVLPRLVGQALRGEPLTVFGEGTQTRTFTHVFEVVEAMIKLLEAPEAEGEVVNIGGVEEVSILELAKRVQKYTKSKSPIKLIPYSEAYPPDFEDMQRRVPSTEKLLKLTGFAPSYPLEKIIEDVVAFERGRIALASRPLGKVVISK